MLKAHVLIVTCRGTQLKSTVKHLEKACPEPDPNIPNLHPLENLTVDCTDCM